MPLAQELDQAQGKHASIMQQTLCLSCGRRGKMQQEEGSGKSSITGRCLRNWAHSVHVTMAIRLSSEVYHRSNQVSCQLDEDCPPSLQ